MIAVGISGEVAAGKTTAARTLARFGFGYTRISMVIDQVLRERGEGRTRERHQTVGLELHETKGQAWLCEQAIALVSQGARAVVLDGIRWPEDVGYMRDRFGNDFIHVHISAPEPVRKLRFEEDEKGIAYEDVVSHPVEQAVGQLVAGADIVLHNDADKCSFQVEILGRVLESHLNAR